MSSKIERPTLQGQRIKTRKRDEKEKFDPTGFRDSILQGFINLQKQSPSSIASTDVVVDLNEKQQQQNSQQTTLNENKDQQSPVNDNSSSNTNSSCSDNNGSSSNGNDTINETIGETNGILKNGTDEFNSSATAIIATSTITTTSTPTTATSTTTTITKLQLDSVYKFLDSSGSKLDYRRYGEVLFDILIAGGHLAPGGTIVTDSDPLKICKTDVCVFNVPSDDIETIRAFAQVIVKLIRRYMYLEKTLEEEFKKVIFFLKGFTSEERIKLAKLTALLISGGQVPVTVLLSALQDHFVKDGLAIDFLITVLQTWLLEKDAATVWAALKKSGLDNRVIEFLPVSKRSMEYLTTVFLNGGLNQLLAFQKASLNSMIKKDLQGQMAKLVKDDAGPKEIIALVKESVAKNNLPEHEIIVLIWNTLMSAVEWNKKEELAAEQALKHLKGYTSLLATFTQSVKSELALIIRVQEFCYENMNFLKVFQKVILLFYKADVLSEDIIIKWYKESHSSKGKSVFLEQMKKMVEWLQNAEEESDGDEQ